MLVFAKAPVAGFAKTRLIPALGGEGAARLAARLLRRAVEQACDAAPGAVTLCCSPDTTHPAFQAWTRDARVTLADQGDGDLGARMTAAFSRTLGDGSERPAVLIGTDAPGLDAAYLREAVQALRHHDAVFGPALDGGYTLVGLRHPAPGLFRDIAWSTAAVMTQTRDRLHTLGLSHAELAPLADIDEPADLVHLPAGWLG